jgi:hypothetical protein
MEKIDFDKQYLVYSSGTINNIESYKSLSNYRVITLNKSHKTLKLNILEQLKSSLQRIDTLFIIGCPIARGHVKKEIECEIINNWILSRNNKQLTSMGVLESKSEILIRQLSKDMLVLGISLPEKLTYQDVKLHIEKNIEQIKKHINFEIKIYKPNENLPNLLLNFNNSKYGIFDIDDTNTSLMDFNDDKYTLNDSFINTIKPTIQSGTLIFLTDFNNEQIGGKLTKYPIYYY